jgi:hypothetical protein
MSTIWSYYWKHFLTHGLYRGTGILMHDTLPRSFRTKHEFHDLAIFLATLQSQLVKGVEIESLRRVLESRCRKETAKFDLAVPGGIIPSASNGAK